ncbi:hypothetical protein OG345_05310 [Streptomyces sp. NBC_01220]|uniref:hypothetical protein n=1 Tax=Streptomyces sp. NBC_01220 TaxID=2903781 RepID=UPI00352E1495|nr:hypothetical protein OG345_05310 [Streptomyces sp. NBC_01220]
MLAALVASVLAVTATACSTDGATPPPPAAAPTAAATAVDSAELTREEGAAKYLDIVKPHNDALDKCMPVLNDVWDSDEAPLADLRKIRSACVDIATTNRQFADDLASITWPIEARDAATQLVDELRADQLAWQEIADARTEDDILDPTYPLTEDGDGAELIRAHLGLPAVEDIATAEG